MAFVTTTTALPKRTRRSTNAATPPRQAPLATLSRRQALLLPLLLVPRAALADRTKVAAKRSYDRYHPRILAAIDTVRQIRTCVGAADAPAASALITDKLFDVKARRALSIYATGFSDNYVGERSRAMLKAVDAFYNELAFVAQGEEMRVHYANALDRLADYYSEARLPSGEITGLGL